MASNEEGLDELGDVGHKVIKVAADMLPLGRQRTGDGTLGD